MGKDKDRTENKVEGDVNGVSLQGYNIRVNGPVNTGGTNTYSGTAIGPNATVNNYGSSDEDDD